MWFNHVLCRNSVGKFCLGSLILFLERAECSTEYFNIQNLLHVEGDSNTNLRKTF